MDMQLHTNNKYCNVLALKYKPTLLTQSNKISHSTMWNKK